MFELDDEHCRGAKIAQKFAVDATAAEPGLVAHWQLKGDSRGRSGRGHNAVNHGVNLEIGSFDGVGAYFEAPNPLIFSFGNGADDTGYPSNSLVLELKSIE